MRTIVLTGGGTAGHVLPLIALLPDLKKHFDKIVFIGGSLIPHGGQNFIEPSRVRDAVLVGPHMHNFTDAMNRAKKADAVMQVTDTLELQEMLEQLLDNENLLEAKCSLAYNWATSETKVLDGIMDKIKAYF